MADRTFADIAVEALSQVTSAGEYSSNMALKGIGLALLHLCDVLEGLTIAQRAEEFVAAVAEATDPPPIGTSEWMAWANRMANANRSLSHPNQARGFAGDASYCDLHLDCEHGKVWPEGSSRNDIEGR